MSLSQNIKILRLEKGLTQEELASSLGVSAQAVSKWETGNTFPDGSLLVPLANKLGVSLDELFDNAEVSMPDISKRIISLIRNTPEKERFNVARDIGWQIERGLFNRFMFLGDRYDPDALKTNDRPSYVLDDNGFTLISNGHSPFFSVFPETEDGYGETVGNGEEMRKIFECLSSPETMRAVICIHKTENNFELFEGSVLAEKCDIDERDMDKVFDDLEYLSLVRKKELEINGEKRILYSYTPSHKIIALFLVAHELRYSGGYSLQADHRMRPFLK